MNEKSFLIKTGLVSTFIVIVYMTVQIVSIMITGYSYSDRLIGYYYGEELQPEDVTLNYDENIIKVSDIRLKNGELWADFSPGAQGSTIIEIVNAKTGVIISDEYYTVSQNGFIMNRNTGNFSGFRLARLYITLLVLVFTVFLWYSCFLSVKSMHYSYRSIFTTGFAIWAVILEALLIIFSARDAEMINFYNVLKYAPKNFILITFPALLGFSVQLCVSNIQLIRREGFRKRNVLGLVLSLILIGGALVLDFIDRLYTGGSELSGRIFAAVTNSLSSIYALFECFLIGAVVCGLLAAKHQPEADMDFLVILGCKVRKDGTLYPLIRSRVDRALEFYRYQLEKTGKKAVFIPSGGQGSDEQVSEADAMKRYLMEQGIPENQILAENRSRNTKENMQNSKQLIEAMGGGKAAFCTNGYHVFRSGIISRQVDFNADGMGARTKWYFWPNAFIREVLGMAVYQWKSLVIMLIPIVIFMVTIQFVF